MRLFLLVFSISITYPCIAFAKTRYGTNRHREYLTLQFVSSSANYVRDHKSILRKNERSKAGRDAGTSLLFPTCRKLVNERSAYL